MHVLIIPSEEFVPKKQPVAGIFQYHQAKILNQGGYTVGVISIMQAFSIVMILKAILLKCINRKACNATDDFSIIGLIKLLYKKVVSPIDFLHVESIEGITVYRIEGLYYLPPSVANNIYGWVKAGMIAFEEYLRRQGRPDILHAHNSLYAAMLAQEVKRKYKINYIVTEHSTVFARALVKNKRLKNKVKCSYKKAEAVFAVSPPFCHLLEQQFRGISFSYLPNVIDPFLEEKKINWGKRSSKEFVFLNIAELHPKKNQELLIRAFDHLKKTLPDKKLSLIIAGGGSEGTKLKQLIQSLKLEDFISLPGLLNREKVFEVLSHSNCFVLSSNYETFGVVLIEAMLLGLPVVSTRCGGPEGFVNKKNGILVEKEDVKSLSEAMRSIIESNMFYDRDEIRNYAISEFGREHFLKQMHHIYNNFRTIS